MKIRRSWSIWPYAVLLFSTVLQGGYLLFPQFIEGVGDVTVGTTPYLLLWLRGLATTALVTTFAWSFVAFVGIYFGPDGIFKHSEALGPGPFFRANSCALLSMFFCGIGIVGVWLEAVYIHLGCVTLAELFFWLFDKSLMGKTSVLSVSGANDETKAWASQLQQRLESWLRYVDRPATLAFLVLLFAIAYLEMKLVLVNTFEVEMLASGAVFFASLTANLAFFAANLPERSVRMAAKQPNQVQAPQA